MLKIDHGALVAQEQGLVRSPHWAAVEKAFLAQNPFCLACGPKVHYPHGLQVHHALIPFHYAILLGRADLELDPRNLLVLCENEKDVTTQDHHILLGHGRNFRRYLPSVRYLASVKYHEKSKAQIEADPDYASLCASMPKEWKDLSDGEKKALRAELDLVLPLAIP